MSESINFYYDFSSSYSYLAQARVDEIEARTEKKVLLQPIVLGAVFHNLGHSVPAADSVKMDYLHMDIKRTATHLGLRFEVPSVFPFNAIEAMRLYYLIEADAETLAKQFSSAVFEAAYARNLDVSLPKNMALLLNELGLDREALITSEKFDHAKIKLKQHTQEAIASGVFGAPTFVYQTERFWGEDRIDQLISTINASTI